MTPAQLNAMLAEAAATNPTVSSPAVEALLATLRPPPAPPPGAVTRLEEKQEHTRLFIDQIIAGRQPSLTITGRGGLGKSYTVRTYLDDQQARGVALDVAYYSRLSPSDLYLLLMSRAGSA